MADSNYAATARRMSADLVRRAGFAGFGRWWADELSAIAPARLRNALERRRLRPVVAIDGERATFWRPVQEGEGYRMQQAATLDLTADLNAVASEGRAAVAALFSPGVRPAVTVALPPQRVLRRQLTLPAAVAENLRTTVGYDLDRLTPFKPEDVYFDAVVASRDAAKGTIVVDVAAARRRVVDHAVAVARTFGADVAAVVPATPQEAASARLDLTPDLDHDDRRGWTRWQVLGPLALLLLLALAAVLIPVWQKRADAIALMHAADAESVRAQESDRLRSELARMTSEYNYTLERKLSHPGPGQVLEEISRLLPEDTWLTQLEYKTTTRGTVQQRDVFMRGESANAGKLVSLLEDARFVGNATPRSPTTKLQPGPGESFDLALKVKDLPLPPTVALADAAVPPAPVRAAPAAAPKDASATPRAEGAPARGMAAPDDATDNTADQAADMAPDAPAEDAPPPRASVPMPPTGTARPLPSTRGPGASDTRPARRPGGFGPFPREQKK